MKNSLLAVFGMVLVVALAGMMASGNLSGMMTDGERILDTTTNARVAPGSTLVVGPTSVAEAWGRNQLALDLNKNRFILVNGDALDYLNHHVASVGLADHVGNVYITSAELAEHGIETRNGYLFTPGGRRVFLQFAIPARGGPVQIVRSRLI